jgi:hypothetical protein
VAFPLSSFADCPVFKPFVNNETWNSCVPDKGILEYQDGVEDLKPISALPGCNPLCKLGLSVSWLFAVGAHTDVSQGVTGQSQHVIPQ